jgi:glutaredoxin
VRLNFLSSSAHSAAAGAAGYARLPTMGCVCARHPQPDCRLKTRFFFTSDTPMKTIVRAFFKTLRLVLGPFVLLFEWLRKPRGLVREPAAQTLVDRQCANLALYQYTTCPFCIKVRQEMRRLSLPIERRDAQKNATNRNALLEGGGAAKVPCLKITDAAGKTQWLYDSTAIITYLRARFAPA